MHMAQKKTITHAIYALIFIWFGWPKIMYFDGKTRPQTSYGWDQRKVQLANHKEANDFMHASAPQSWVPWF